MMMMDALRSHVYFFCDLIFLAYLTMIILLYSVVLLPFGLQIDTLLILSIGERYLILSELELRACFDLIFINI